MKITIEVSITTCLGYSSAEGYLQVPTITGDPSAGYQLTFECAV